MQNNQPKLEEKQRIDEIISLLKRKIKFAQFFGRTYFALNDWIYVIALFITIVSPFAFAAIIFFPATKDNIGIISLILSALGSLISMIRVTTKLGERAVFDLRRKADCECLLNKILLNTITVEETIIELHKIELCEIEEPKS